MNTNTPNYDPITHLPIVDSVFGPDGRMYERFSLVEWITAANNAGIPLVSPATNMPMTCTMNDIREIEQGGSRNTSEPTISWRRLMTTKLGLSIDLVDKLGLVAARDLFSFGSLKPVQVQAA